MVGRGFRNANHSAETKAESGSSWEIRESQRKREIRRSQSRKRRRKRVSNRLAG